MLILTGRFIRTMTIMLPALIGIAGCMPSEGEVDIKESTHAGEYLRQITAEGPLDCEQDHIIIRAKSLKTQSVMIAKKTGRPSQSGVEETTANVKEGEWFGMVSPEVDLGDTVTFELLVDGREIVGNISARRPDCLTN